jgi:hypothetical protein
MKTVIILGEARSGTSMVAGLTHLLGVNMHPKDNPSEQNPKGSFEDPEFIGLTQKLYLENWQTNNLETIAEIVRIRNADDQDWGWKSALTHYVLEWFLLYVKNPHLIATFRSPLANAQSWKKHMQSEYATEVSIIKALVQMTKGAEILADTIRRHQTIPQLYTSYEYIKINPIREAERIANFLDIEFTEERRELVISFILNYSTIKDVDSPLMPAKTDLL